MSRLCLLLFFWLAGLVGSAPAFSAEQLHHYAYFAREREQLQLPEFMLNPDFEGAQIMYSWRELEPQPGAYDFSDIRQDLKALKAHHKRLFIQLQDTTFGPRRKAIPLYLEQNPLYHGGAVPQYDDQDGSIQGWVARRWDPQVQARFHALLCALGHEFDGQLAGINLQETAIEVMYPGKPVPAGFSPSLYRDAVLVNMQALKSCFPHTLVMQYANFMPGEWLPSENHGYLESVYAYAQKHEIAVGAPDLMPERKGQQNHAYKQMHNGHNCFGVAIQDGNYWGATGNPKLPKHYSSRIPALFAYAEQYLHVQYLFWVVQEPFFSRDLVPFLKQQRS